MIFGGIDAGGTASKGILLAEDGRLLAEAIAGPANYQVVGLKRAAEEIRKLLDQLCQAAKVSEVDLLGVGLAGAGSPEDLEKLRAEILPLKKASTCYLTDDGEIAVLGAHAGRPGLVVIAGTGSIVYGLGSDGRKVRAGGWGPLLGDEGSGFWIGLKAMQAIIKAAEQRGPATLLSELICQHLGIKQLRQLVPIVYQDRLPRRLIAALTPLVIQALTAGDQVASRIIDQGLAELALTVERVYQELGSVSLPTGVIGGLFNSQQIYEIFRKKLGEFGDYQVIRPHYSPVFGAAFYALKERGINLTLVNGEGYDES